MSRQESDTTQSAPRRVIPQGANVSALMAARQAKAAAAEGTPSAAIPRRGRQAVAPAFPPTIPAQQLIIRYHRQQARVYYPSALFGEVGSFRDFREYRQCVEAKLAPPVAEIPEPIKTWRAEGQIFVLPSPLSEEGTQVGEVWITYSESTREYLRVHSFGRVPLGVSRFVHVVSTVDGRFELALQLPLLGEFRATNWRDLLTRMRTLPSDYFYEVYHSSEMLTAFPSIQSGLHLNLALGVLMLPEARSLFAIYVRALNHISPHHLWSCFLGLTENPVFQIHSIHLDSEEGRHFLRQAANPSFFNPARINFDVTAERVQSCLLSIKSHEDIELEQVAVLDRLHEFFDQFNLPAVTSYYISKLREKLAADETREHPLCLQALSHLAGLSLEQLGWVIIYCVRAEMARSGGNHFEPDRAVDEVAIREFVHRFESELKAYYSRVSDQNKSLFSHLFLQLGIVPTWFSAVMFSGTRALSSVIRLRGIRADHTTLSIFCPRSPSEGPSTPTTAVASSMNAEMLATTVVAAVPSLASAAGSAGAASAPMPAAAASAVGAGASAVLASAGATPAAESADPTFLPLLGKRKFLADIRAILVRSVQGGMSVKKTYFLRAGMRNREGPTEMTFFPALRQAYREGGQTFRSRRGYHRRTAGSNAPPQAPLRSEGAVAATAAQPPILDASRSRWPGLVHSRQSAFKPFVRGGSTATAAATARTPAFVPASAPAPAPTSIPTPAPSAQESRVAVALAASNPAAVSEFAPIGPIIRIPSPPPSPEATLKPARAVSTWLSPAEAGEVGAAASAGGSGGIDQNPLEIALQEDPELRDLAARHGTDSFIFKRAATGGLCVLKDISFLEAAALVDLAGFTERDWCSINWDALERELLLQGFLRRHIGAQEFGSPAIKYYLERYIELGLAEAADFCRSLSAKGDRGSWWPSSPDSEFWLSLKRPSH